MKRTRKESQRGSAVLEFALAFALLWALFAGIYQFGYAFYVYNVLLTSVGNAAQLGSKITYDTSNPGNYTTELTNMVLYGNTTAGTNPVVPGLSSSNVNVNVVTSNAIPTNISISITGYTIDAVFTKFTFNGKPRAAAAYLGQIACSG